MYIRSTSAVHLEKTASRSIWRISVSCFPPIFCPVKKKEQEKLFLGWIDYDIRAGMDIEMKYILLVDFVVNWFQLVENK
jgi:hypothetical protein